MAKRFHALLVVRDEADIIEQSLWHLSTWADAVYVFDTGSVDGTWESVQSVAEENSKIHPIARKPVYFSLPKVRSYLFHRVREHMQDGDWFLRVDADERYHVPPPEFVEKRMKSYETVAWRQYYDFRLTEEDVKRWQDGREGFGDRERPIEERRRCFTVSRNSEPRLCQYRSTMKWPNYASFPHHAGVIAKERLPIRHYPHRDPVQMAKRYALRSIQVRAENSKTDKSLEHHWAVTDWKKDVVSNNRGDLHRWKPGQSLPKVQQRHTRPGGIRLLKRLFYALPSVVVDGWKEGYKVDYSLDRLPDQIQQEIREAYTKIKHSGVRSY
jgi:hypothetical protein